MSDDDDWQVILVDDRIPCDANGHPVFCRHPDQRTYWGMIIEKAYAKFAGCYEAMQGGTVTQGLEDLTGGVGYKFDLLKREKEWIPPKGETPERVRATAPHDRAWTMDLSARSAISSPRACSSLAALSPTRVLAFAFARPPASPLLSYPLGVRSFGTRSWRR